MEVIEIDQKELKKAKRKAKRREFLNKVKSKGRSALDWIDIHREETIAIAAGVTAVGGVTAKAIKGHNKKKALAEERDLKELYVYDRRLGHYWKVRRKLTNSEWLEVDRRVREGQRMADVLSDLRLL